MKSVWEDGALRPAFNGLESDARCDVLVIGGGIAGVLCAYELTKRGVDCILVDAERICGGITKNTTAKITVQHGLIYDKMIKRFGLDFARGYISMQSEALARYRELCSKIDSDYSIKASCVYTLRDVSRLEGEQRALERLGCHATLEKHTELPFEVSAALFVPGQAEMHPLKLLYALADKLRIYENTCVREIRDGVAVTDRARIKAEHIIVATHFPFINKHGLYFLKMYQNRSYVLGIESDSPFRGMYVDEADGGLSFRTHKNVLLIGGGAHRTGKKGGGWRVLSDFASKYYPQSRELYRYATQDCMTLDGIPYIGRYSKRTKNLYVASGFNKWGMTSSMVAARLLTDMVLDRKNECARIFSPQRSIMRPQLAVNAFESAVGLLTPTVPRCPHLGCALKYNPQEHSWDCPCHGSRFAEDGELLDNPATKNKSL